ncbi:unnamed protein product [Rotaria magnacalcarata]
MYHRTAIVLIESTKQKVENIVDSLRCYKDEYVQKLTIIKCLKLITKHWAEMNFERTIHEENKVKENLLKGQGLTLPSYIT